MAALVAAAENDRYAPSWPIPANAAVRSPEQALAEPLKTCNRSPDDRPTRLGRGPSSAVEPVVTNGRIGSAPAIGQWLNSNGARLLSAMASVSAKSGSLRQRRPSWTKVLFAPTLDRGIRASSLGRRPRLAEGDLGNPHQAAPSDSCGAIGTPGRRAATSCLRSWSSGMRRWAATRSTRLEPRGRRHSLDGL
jgi:hypothetical protein